MGQVLWEFLELVIELHDDIMVWVAVIPWSVDESVPELV
jgi:hypothetical protein